MFGLSLGHMLIILVIVLLLNAKRLPELGSALGKGMHAFKKGIEGKSHENEKDPNDPDSKDT
ncbi:MAG: twin-arginine translocase TatA/TatE family subunit [Bdellovibrionales bacterium]|nr:twin-arginine translocase TatA/TatE family subunit [Bdellovibrionales bacterium]